MSPAQLVVIWIAPLRAQADGHAAVVGPGSPRHSGLAHGRGEVVGLLQADGETLEAHLVVACQRQQLAVVDRLLPDGAEALSSRFGPKR